MSKKLYEELLHSLSFHRNMGDDDAKLLQTTGGLWVNDVFFYILADEKPDADQVAVYCVFGMLPSDREAEAMRALLQENTGMFPYAGPVFTINPQDSNVLLAHRYALSVLNADNLLGILEAVSQEALKWRRTFYLDESLPVGDQTATSLHYDFV